MLKRTLAGLGFVLVITMLGSAPASAFGWCGSGYGYSPFSFFYSPRPSSYYRPRAFYRPVAAGAYYRPGIRMYRRAYYRPFVGRAALYRPGVRVYRRDFYRPGVRRAFYRPGVRVDRPLVRTGYRAGAWGGRGIPARYRGRLP
jgi:hypothetical protein